jgi:hypothetical protein
MNKKICRCREVINSKLAAVLHLVNLTEENTNLGVKKNCFHFFEAQQSY